MEKEKMENRSPNETPTLVHLADQPAGVDQMSRARELCGKSETLHAKLDAFLHGKPSRGQMLEFLEELRATGAREQLDANIQRICESVGIGEPTGTDKLLAMQIGLLQEQNETLALVANRVGALANQKQPVFTPLVAGIVLGTVLAK
jgi:hypothetical protein